MSKHRIAVLPGDGIGREVTPWAVKALQATGLDWEFVQAEVGWECFQRQGTALPEATGLADRRNMVYSGTHGTAGRARGVVVATGAHTEVGRIAGLTEGAQEPTTPLERRIEQFGRWLVGAALALFVLVVLAATAAACGVALTLSGPGPQLTPVLRGSTFGGLTLLLFAFVLGCRALVLVFREREP